jgi:hypothetical protein
LIIVILTASMRQEDVSRGVEISHAPKVLSLIIVRAIAETGIERSIRIRDCARKEFNATTNTSAYYRIASEL